MNKKTLNPKRILIVDDEINGLEFLADLIKEILPKAQITKKQNPLDAIEATKRQTFDMIFSDIRMPHITGLEMLRQIKTPKYHPYIVLVSAYGEFDYAKEGIEVGVNSYILKPLTLEKVQCEIRRYYETLQNSTKVATIAVRRGNKRFPVNIEDIKAIIKEDSHFITVYTTNGIIDCISSNLKEIQQCLPDNFIYINRRTIINCLYVKFFCHFSKTLVIELPDGELHFETSRNGYIKYLEKCRYLIG